MPYAGAPWFSPGTVLFSRGKSTYEMVEDLGPGHHGERVLVALQCVKGNARGRVILKALPLPKESTFAGFAKRTSRVNMHKNPYASQNGIKTSI